MSRALSEEEASKEMKKMVTFIMQEANEKAKEIRIKADEEFNIEKAKLVRQETTAIETGFAKKLVQVEVKRKISQSNQINKSRLRILQHRDEQFESVMADAFERLPSLKADAGAYEILLYNLILEVLFRFMEKDVVFECVAADEFLVKSALEQATKEFARMTGMALRGEIRPELDSTCVGGVVGIAKGGKIRCSNTLKDRLEIFSQNSMPEIRAQLFD